MVQLRDMKKHSDDAPLASLSICGVLLKYKNIHFMGLVTDSDLELCGKIFPLSGKFAGIIKRKLLSGLYYSKV